MYSNFILPETGKPCLLFCLLQFAQFIVPYLKKSELAKAAELSTYAMTKLNNDRPVNMEVMLNLCKVFHCDIGDLMEVIEED